MTDEAAKNRAEIERIKTELNHGKITYEEAKNQAAPTLKKINDHAKELARKYGRKHRGITFSEIMR